MADQKSKLEELEEFIDERVSKRVGESEKELESRMDQKLASAPAVHTESRTSKWVGYQPSSDGSALREWVACHIRAHEAGERQNAQNQYANLERYASEPEFVKRVLVPHMEERDVVAGSGGAAKTLRSPLFQEILGQLRVKATLLNMVQVRPMETKTLDISDEVEKATFAWTAESDEITASQYDTASTQLVAKKCAGRVRVTNDFLRMDPLMKANWITDKMIQDLAVEMERAILLGSAGGPADIFAEIHADNKFELIGSSDLAAYEAKVHEIAEAVTTDPVNVSLQDVKVLSGISHVNFLRRQRTSGNRIFGETRSDMELDQYPLSASGLIGNDFNDAAETASSGTGVTNATRVYAGDFQAYILGIMTTPELSISEHQFHSSDLTQFRLVQHADGKMPQNKRVAVLTTNIANVS